MSNMSDAEFLRRYAESGDQSAFANVVRAHLGLVYSVAYRQVGGDAHLAEDVTQMTFTALAKKALELAKHPVLGGWLYRTACFYAVDLVRADRRRRGRELAAVSHEGFLIMGEQAPEWEQLRPVLDEVIAGLGDEDRDAVVMRFFEKRAFAEVGTVLGVSENAARMRVDRALEKMQASLARRGVTSMAVAIGSVLGGQVAKAAPAGLALKITGSAVAANLVSIAGGVTTVAWGVGFAKMLVAAMVLVGAVYLWMKPQRGEEMLVSHGKRFEEKWADGEAQMEETSLVRDAGQTEPSVSQVSGADPGADTKVRTLMLPTKAQIEDIERRYQQGRAWAKEGRVDEALEIFWWCFDEGMRDVVGYETLRCGVLLKEIVHLSAHGTRAMGELRQRRDRAERMLEKNGRDVSAAVDAAAINAVLKQNGRTLGLWDRLTLSGKVKRALGNYVRHELLAEQRYVELMELTSYVTMELQFRKGTALPKYASDPAAAANAVKLGVRAQTLTSIEILIGAGKKAEAMMLADALMKYETSSETRMEILKRAKRAGWPEFFKQ